MDMNIVKLKKYAAVCSVLYVEDDEIIRNATTTFLQRFFTDVTVAEDGAQALELYKHKNFDIVITDINMPNMNGIKMIEAMKEIYFGQAIIVTSAYNDSDSLMKFIELGVDRFVLKPFNNKQFLYILYKVAEELTYAREREDLEDQLEQSLKQAQNIIDHIDIGIVILKDNITTMVNHAFLKIGGFDSFETLQLEMPELGVLFEESAHSISAATNAEFIQKLQQVTQAESIVKILVEGKTIEYQVNLTHIKDDDAYIVTFTDITALHNAMNVDIHTKLPTRKFLLEKLELLKHKSSHLTVILLQVQHFKGVEKTYGKHASIEVEVEFAHLLKVLKVKKLPHSFIGYFSKNCFVVIPPNKPEVQEFLEAVKNLRISTKTIEKLNENIAEPLELSANLEIVKLDTTKEMNQIEVDLINTFDFM